ncbi:MAG: hypothetical protein NXI24_20820 [bacterium]|nr:hypothetical protein [bacterium]
MRRSGIFFSVICPTVFAAVFSMISVGTLRAQPQRFGIGRPTTGFDIYEPYGNSFSGARLNASLGSHFSYDSRVSESLGNIRTFSVPVIIPLEATIGRFFMGGSFEYAVREYRQEGRNENVEGPRYLSAHGGFNFFRNGPLRVEFRETVNAPIARDNGRFDAPREAWLNSGGYRFDSELSSRYLFDRADIRVGVGHRWRMARENYNPGETILANVTFGYGLGSYSHSQGTHPLTVLAGISTRYNYADKLDGDNITGTEYGTVFFAPGLQLATQSLRLQAMVEVPIHNIKPEEDSYSEEVRANVGLKYYIY